MWQSKDLSQKDRAKQLLALIQEADALVIGIGAGMSAADGFTYVGPRFEDAFPDFIEAYHFLDMLQASLFDFPSWAEYWAFQSRFVCLNYLDQPVGDSYLALKDLIQDKDYHIITTNADNAFWVADYDPQRIFHIQGEYGLMQCSQHCHAQTYQDHDLMRYLARHQRQRQVAYEAIPLCPQCGAPLEINKRNAEKGMVEDADFMAQLARYEAFLAHHEQGKVLYLEIGVGFTTPQFIKHPFYRRVAANSEALLVTLNQKQYRLPLNIQAQTLWFPEDSRQLLLACRDQMLAAQSPEGGQDVPN